ncbi:MAG: hypothetical protein ACPF9D_09150 [Owenweeksia sp.]
MFTTFAGNYDLRGKEIGMSTYGLAQLIFKISEAIFTISTTFCILSK